MKTLGMLVLACAASIALAGQGIRVKIEQRVALFDVPPAYRNGVAMVPIRGLMDAMDGTIKWNMGTQTVHCWANGKRIELVLNSRSARVDDRNSILEEGAFVHKGRVYAPLRFVAHAAGYVVSEEDNWFVLRPLNK